MSILDPDDPLFRPITMAEAMARTGRSRRTIDRWVKDGHLRRVQLEDRTPIFVEREVVEYDKRMRDNLRASWRPAPKRPPGAA
jgi:predicted DNA-binding transcriptional regulator AlpA